jgi:hypothetical protein
MKALGNRPGLFSYHVGMKKFLIVIGVLFVLFTLLLASLGVWAYYKFLYTEPLTQAELEELSIDWDEATGGNWSPWWDPGTGTLEWNPAASYNEWLASVPEEYKAWPLMVDACYDHLELYKNEFFGTMPTDPGDWERLVPTLATPEADELFKKALLAFEKPVMGAWWNNDEEPYEHAAMLRYAQSHPESEPRDENYFEPGQLNFDPIANTPMIEMLLPSLGRHRQFTNFVRSKAAYELEQGNAEVFVSAMEASLNSADLSKEIPTLIGVLVETAIESVTIRTIDWGISAHREKFDAAMLERLGRVVGAFADATFVWQGEALMFHDTLRRMGDKNGRLPIVGSQTMQDLGWQPGILRSPTNLPDAELHASSQRTMHMYKKVLKSASSQGSVPWDGTRGQAMAILQQEEGKANYMASLFLDIMLPSLENVGRRTRQHRQEVIGLRLGIAALLHEKRHGQFPASIAAIDPDLVDFDPIDVFTGAPLGYRVNEDGPLVYSVGPDRIDNGGTQGWIGDVAWNDQVYQSKMPIEWVLAEDSAALFSDPTTQWDWVLFPVPEDDEVPEDSSYDPDWDLEQDGLIDGEPGESEPAEELPTEEEG